MWGSCDRVIISPLREEKQHGPLLPPPAGMEAGQTRARSASCLFPPRVAVILQPGVSCARLLKRLQSPVRTNCFAPYPRPSPLKWISAAGSPQGSGGLELKDYKPLLSAATWGKKTPSPAVALPAVLLYVRLRP